MGGFVVKRRKGADKPNDNERADRCANTSDSSVKNVPEEKAATSSNRPPAPVNVTVTHLKANSATVSWDVPEGDVIIGYAISQQRQDGQMQRFIREVNTTNRACVLWDLAEDADYIIQVQSISLHGESQASKRVHFRTLKETDRLPSNSSNQGDITVEGLDKQRQLQTGEIVIIVTVLLMWAAVIALFCRQYDIIKDNDSNNNKEKTKPSSEHSTPERPTGGLLRSKDFPKKQESADPYPKGERQ
ncbi:Fibronectin type III domain-containing protein 4 [Chelonia mydas]|uniref:Fibronectin type III domain-containing protein 4 n=1 Tax=Chelonia mydas TaxID=8469 RepID=M7BJ26_CHEMY|nr:Fibronectin type III domain-containing protein 4 [Chelonia mydas]